MQNIGTTIKQIIAQLKRQLNIKPTFRRTRASFHFQRRCLLYKLQGPKKDVLVYVGGHIGNSLMSIVWDYKRCYVFEPYPKHFKKLKARFDRLAHVKCYPAAVGKKTESAILHISDNNAGSSSLGYDVQDMYHSGPFRLTQSVEVPCIYLPDFLKKENISYIDDYISDIQGMDYAVLTTLRPWIDAQKIGSIQCEVTVNNIDNYYKGLPSNNEKHFERLLKGKYRLAARGYTWLKEGNIAPIPKHAWEIDYKWRSLSSEASK